jgi:hypothetical protein
MKQKNGLHNKPFFFPGWLKAALISKVKNDLIYLALITESHLHTRLCYDDPAATEDPAATKDDKSYCCTSAAGQAMLLQMPLLGAVLFIIKKLEFIYKFFNVVFVFPK